MADFEVSTTQWDALLQENYVIDSIVDAINKATVFKSKLGRKRMSYGRRDIYSVNVGTHQGVGARAENARLPQYGAGQYQDAIVTSKYNYAQAYITGQSKSFSTRKAFVDFAMRLIKDTKEGMTLDIGRQCWGDGSGTLALVNNGGGYAIGSTAIVVDSAYGVAWGCLAANTTFLFKQKMTLQFGTEDNAGLGYEVSSFTGTTLTVTPGLVAAIADNARVYRLGAKDNEIEGWLKLVGTSTFMTSTLSLANDTYHNIDRSDYTDWAGNVLDQGAAISLANTRTLKDLLFRRGGNAELCIGSPEILRDYEALLTPNQRYVPALKLEGGFTALEHDGLAFVKDKDAPVKALNLVTTSEIAWSERGDPFWKKQGDSIFRVVSGYDAEEATLCWYSNLDCSAPRQQALGYNYTVT
jgi:hypothetical protein